jgi:TonB family protein
MKMLKVSLLFRCATVLFAAYGAAQEIPTPQQLIDAAHKVSDLSQLGPYILNANVVVNPGDKKHESAGLLAIAHDHGRTRVELAFGGVHETRIFLDNKEYVEPGKGQLYTAELNRFDQSWDPAHVLQSRFAAKYRFGEVRREKVQGVDAWCFDQIYEHSRGRACFDAARAVLLRKESGGKPQREFLDFKALGQQMYPQRVQVFREFRSPIEISHIAINPATLKDELFAIPANSIELESCDDMKPPKATYTPEPEFSEKARREHIKGVVVLVLLITKEGQVNSVQVTNPDSYGLGDNASAAAKRWRFNPATCGSGPVNMEMAVEVEFH